MDGDSPKYYVVVARNLISFDECYFQGLEHGFICHFH